MNDKDKKADASVDDPLKDVQLPEGYTAIKSDELEAMKTRNTEMNGIGKRLDYLEKSGPNFAAQPPQPEPPKGPTVDEQVVQLDKDLETLDSQIDKAIEDEKPVSSLLRERDKINEKKIRLRTEESVNVLRSQGLQSISQLSKEISQAKMPYLEAIPEIKTTYEAMLAKATPEMLSNPESLSAAYNFAVGQNMTKVIDFEREKAQRAADADNPPPPPPGKTGRDIKGGGEGGEKPTFEEHFGEDAMNALKRQNVTKDEFAKKLGYKDADDYLAQALAQEEEAAQ